MLLPFSLLLLLPAVIPATAAQPNPRPAEYTHATRLDERYTLEWRPEADSIAWRVSVETHGYIGLGFSPSGGMDGADIVLGWVGEGGAVYLSDRRAVGNHAPYLDASQDLQLEAGYENDTHTVIQFSRYRF